MVTGMNRHTGALISDTELLRQSIICILTTPKGSRVYRREFGSDLFKLLDSPNNEALMIDIYASIADALVRWEPRFQLQNIQARTNENGQLVVSLRGVSLINGEQQAFDGLILT